MKDIIYEILSEIHRLLSIASEEELRCASGLPNTSPHIRAALLALAAEKSSTKRRIDAHKSEPSKSPRPTGTPQRNSKSESNAVAREIARALEKLDKNEIQIVCHSVGLELPIKAKDARNRIIQRTINAILALPDGERNRVLGSLRNHADSQTEGWVGVIRKGE